MSEVHAGCKGLIPLPLITQMVTDREELGLVQQQQSVEVVQAGL